MNRTEISTKVSDVIAHILKINKDTIHEQSTLESLGADSLNRVEFVIELEDTFGIEINDDEAEKLDTVGQTIDYVEKMLVSKK